MMNQRDPRFQRSRQPNDGLPLTDDRHQFDMRAHHSLGKNPERYDASHTDKYYPERYLQSALNWNNRDLTLSDDGADAKNHRGRGPKGYSRSDERILEEVCDRLNDDHHVDASDITVTCSNGIVTLEGTVDSRMTKRRAEDIVDHCSGVKDVHNRLTITDNIDRSAITPASPGLV
jgi:hypothetical protein